MMPRLRPLVLAFGLLISAIQILAAVGQAAAQGSHATDSGGGNLSEGRSNQG